MPFWHFATEKTKKDSLDELMKVFKRRGQRTLRMCCSQIRPHNTETARIFGHIPKNSLRGFWSRGATVYRQGNLIDKTPDLVQTILNRAYLEEKPYNNIVLL